MENTTIITGSPFQAGATVWEKQVLPFLKAANNRPPQEIQQFYAGLLVSAYGAMVADFGLEQTDELYRSIVDRMSDLGKEIPGARTQ